MVQIALFAVACAFLAAQCEATLSVRLVDRVFVANKDEEFKLLQSTVTRSSYHAKSKHIYTVGKMVFYILRDKRF